MEDKKQSVAILLIILIVITYFQYVSSKDQKQKALKMQKAQATAQEIAVQPTSQGSATPSPAQLTVAGMPASLEQLQKSEKTAFSNDALQVTFNLLGARIQALELTGIYKDLTNTSLFNLINLEDKVSLPAGIKYADKNDDTLQYVLESAEGVSKNEQGALISNAQQSKLVFTATLSNGQKLIKTYSFEKGSYLFRINAQITDSSNRAIELNWPVHVKKADLEQRYDPYFFSLLAKDNKISHVQALSSLDSLKNNQNASWLSFGDRYFMTAIVPQSQDSSVRVDTAEELFTLVNRTTGNQTEMIVYAGPKNHEALKAYNLSFERSIDLGFISFIADPLLKLLRILFSFFGNYGVAIVALTLIVKNALYPLNKASLTSMKAMQELSPEIQALKERVKDPTQLNKEIFALYKRKGVNPMGGCLPIAIQIPVFFGLYSALQNAVELRHAPFALWVKDLATPEKLNILGLNVPVIVLAMGAIMFIQQYRTPMPNVDPAQRKMVLSMSVVFTLMFLIFPFPAGLAIYMFVNTLISLIQQQSLKSDRFSSPFAVTAVASVVLLAISIALTKL